jgi:hypothetical protein
MTGELVSATHLVMVMANASNWADPFDDSERNALRLVVTEVTNAQAEIERLALENAELATALDNANGVIRKFGQWLDGWTITPTCNRRPSEVYGAWDRVREGWAEKLDPAAILAAHDKALTEPLEARIVELSTIIAEIWREVAPGAYQGIDYSPAIANIKGLCMGAVLKTTTEFVAKRDAERDKFWKEALIEKEVALGESVARIAELEAQVKACHMERDNLKGNLAELEAQVKTARADALKERGSAYAIVCDQLIARYVEVFPNYAWMDPNSAIDLMTAEIKTLRMELADREGA